MVRLLEGQRPKPPKRTCSTTTMPRLRCYMHVFCCKSITVYVEV